MLTGDSIDRHQHQSPNIEETDNDTRINQKQDIVDIEPTSGSDSEVSDVGGASQEGTSDTDNDITLWFRKIIFSPSPFLES